MALDCNSSDLNSDQDTRKSKPPQRYFPEIGTKRGSSAIFDDHYDNFISYLPRFASTENSTKSVEPKIQPTVPESPRTLQRIESNFNSENRRHNSCTGASSHKWSPSQNPNSAHSSLNVLKTPRRYLDMDYQRRSTHTSPTSPVSPKTSTLRRRIAGDEEINEKRSPFHSSLTRSDDKPRYRTPNVTPNKRKHVNGNEQLPQFLQSDATSRNHFTHHTETYDGHSREKHYMPQTSSKNLLSQEAFQREVLSE